MKEFVIDFQKKPRGEEGEHKENDREEWVRVNGLYLAPVLFD